MASLKDKKDYDRLVIDNEKYHVELGQDISIPVISENFVDLQKTNNPKQKKPLSQDQKK